MYRSSGKSGCVKSPPSSNKYPFGTTLTVHNIQKQCELRFGKGSSFPSYCQQIGMFLMPIYMSWLGSYGVHILFIQQTYGVHVLFIRRSHGVHMAFIRRSYDVHLAFIRCSYDVYTVLVRRSCLVHGVHTALTWRSWRSLMNWFILFPT